MTAKARKGAGAGPSAGPVEAAPEVRTVPIKALVRNPEFQVRQHLDDATISRYANALAEGRTMPPVKVAAVNGALIVVDGWHRLAAHERRGRAEVEAEIVEATISDAQWMAAAANLTHGLPLRKAEIRTAFRAMIKARRHYASHPANAKAAEGAIRPGTLLSYRDLAGMLAGLVRHTTLRNWMMQDFPHLARIMRDEAADLRRPGGKRDEEAVFFNTVKAALDNAKANAGGVRDPDRRGEMIEAARDLLQHLERGGSYALCEF